MNHQPPPFFKRGPAPLALLTFYVALSVAVMVLDARFHATEFARQAISIVTYPMQRVVQAPVAASGGVGDYFTGVAGLQAENLRLRRAQLDSAPSWLRLKQLEAENNRLRRMLELRERQQAKGSVAQILYSARDAFSRRIVVDKGAREQIVAGQPVVDDLGVLGQVTRVYPLVSEVTLITDKDQAVPVQVVRNGLRSVLFGLGNGLLELRYIPANADVQNGDLLVTSGLDGIYLAGFPVAKVTKVERDTAYSFARITCVPVAGVENYNEVMILSPHDVATPRPPDAPGADQAGEPGGRGRKRASRKD